MRGSLPKRSNPIRWTVLGLSASLLLSSACAHSPLVLPDPTVPHRVAEPAAVKVWCRLPDGRTAKCAVRLDPGWWVASPQVVEVP